MLTYSGCFPIFQYKIRKKITVYPLVPIIVDEEDFGVSSTGSLPCQIF